MEDRDIQSGCMLPALQAGVTGFLAGIGVLTLSLLNAASPVTALLSGILAGCIASGFVWIWLLRAVYAPPPAPVYYPPLLEAQPEAAQSQTVRVELWDEPNQAAQFARLPASVEQLTDLARGVLAGQSLSEVAWTGTGKPFTRPEFSTLRAELIRRNLARWNSPGTPARGIAMTPGGMALLRHLAREAEDNELDD